MSSFSSDDHQRTPSLIFSIAKRKIRSDNRATAQEIFEENSELESAPLYALELVFEEYLQWRHEANFSFESFANRYPKYHQKLLKLISVDKALSNPGVSADMGLTKWPKEHEGYGDFELLERIGRGAFSAVFLAKQKSVSNREVIVKFTRAQSSEVEVEALSQLSHHHIVPIYTVSWIDSLNLSAICMPYRGRLTLHDLLREFRTLNGERPQADSNKSPEFQSILDTARAGELSTLSPRKDRTQPTDQQNTPHVEEDGTENEVSQTQQNEQASTPPPQLGDAAEASPDTEPEGPATGVQIGYHRRVLEYGIQILEGLAYAHDRSIFHCDLKPSNILIDDDDQAQLFDFNLAVTHDEAERGGTLPYMAPEQLRVVAGESGDQTLDGRTDLFGWAATFYEMLTGKFAFDIHTSAASGESVATLDAASLLKLQSAGVQSLPDAVPEDVQQIILACLAYQKLDRPVSAAEVSDRLRNALSRYDGQLRLLPNHRAIPFWRSFENTVCNTSW